MAQTHHTIILIPHARAKLRKWRVSNPQIAVAAGCILFLAFGSLGVSWLYFRSNASPAQIARLEAENKKLRATNSSFESSLSQLKKRLRDTEDRTRQLAIVAGLESLGEAEPGVGGPVEDSSFDGLDDIARRTGDVSGQLNEIATRLDERLDWISSTPAIAPVRGILTSGYGSRSDPLTHGRGRHEGVDIAAPAGHPVQAPADGIVVRAESAGGYGNAVFLSHGFGLSTTFGHLSEIDVRPGQRVKRGDTIGKVGSTGRSTGYHLHYEVHVDGAPVNPLAYMLDEPNGP